MKKFIVAALAASLSLGGAAIASAADKVGVVVKIGGIPWFNAMEAGIKEQGQKLGLDAFMVGPTSAGITVPSGRRRGAQAALLHARLAFAAEQGCDLAMMGAAPGSASQRNAERQGFRIAYTRVKWHLPGGTDAG